MLVDRPRFALFALPLLGAVVLAAASACQQVPSQTYDGDDDDGWLKPDIPWGEEDPPLPSTGTPGDDDDSEGNEDGEDEGEPKLDMPPHEMPLAECTVVDLLFVIDNSGSMLDEQEQLIASFDGFVAGIQEYLDEANDYHIGVVTTDAYALNPGPCRSLGALVTESAAGVCGPWAAGNYISLADDLASSFTCAGHVGDQGNGDEHQIEAALRAISSELGEPGACNEGFIRDDALLVLVVITDEDDKETPAGSGSAGDPDDWFADIVARKGVETNVVTLALTGVSPLSECAIEAHRIEQFVDNFTYGRIGDVCATDYAPFFEASLEIIQEACVNFTPEG